MGGLGSGRIAQHWTVADSLCLKISVLQKARANGEQTSGTLSWSLGRQGVATINFSMQTRETGGWLFLHWNEHDTFSGQQQRRQTHIGIASMPQPLGGRRWWFICPKTGQRVSQLYLPPGADMFASRRAYGLVYPSQRETRPYRALRRAFALRERLGNRGDIADPIYKPKHMHRRTFERALVKLEIYGRVIEAHSDLLHQRAAPIEPLFR